MDLNLYLGPRGRAPVWLVLLTLAALGASFTAGLAHQRLSAHSEAVARQIAHIQIAPRPKARATRAEEERRDQWVKLAAERGFDWYPLFLALERANSDDIELLEFRPDKANRQLALRGEARDLPALTKYLERLSEQRPIRQVYLSHQNKITRDALQVVSFEIHASVGVAENVSNLQLSLIK